MRITILFLGQPGCGKTHLAVALATTAVEAGFRGYFTTADDMVNTLVRAKREGTFFTQAQDPDRTHRSSSSTMSACFPSTGRCRGVLPRRQHPL